MRSLNAGIKSRNPTPTLRPYFAIPSLASFGACVNREAMNSLFARESEDRANKPNKTLQLVKEYKIVLF